MILSLYQLIQMFFQELLKFRFSIEGFISKSDSVGSKINFGVFASWSIVSLDCEHRSLVLLHCSQVLNFPSLLKESLCTDIRFEFINRQLITAKTNFLNPTFLGGGIISKTQGMN